MLLLPKFSCHYGGVKIKVELTISRIKSMNLNFKLDNIPKQVLRCQLVVLCGLLLISGISRLYQHSSSVSLQLLYVDAEASIATWYSVLLLLLCATLLAIIALMKSKTKSRYIRHWQVLALIFIVLSIDESVSIHEKLMVPIKSALNIGGVFHFAWIILYIPLVALFVIFYLRFLAYLPRTTRKLFWLSGITYVAGAIGFEMISGPIAETSGTEALPFVISVHFEEGLEILGLTFFVYALLGYISSYLERVVVCFKSAQKFVAPQSRASKAGGILRSH